MDTYTLLRGFADSWFLIAMTAFFMFQVLWAFRPSAKEKHRKLAELPLRNDRLED